MRLLPVLFVIGFSMLNACSPAPTGTTTSSNTVETTTVATAEPMGPAASANSSADASDYSGHWTGVEGMYLVVTLKPAGGVALEMQWDLDHKGTFDGTVTPAGIQFVRNGVTETLKPSHGDATGLKYLAGKKDCLTVKSGEGYCR